MTLGSSILLGLVQGLTEFLPISSSAHLILLRWLLNIPSVYVEFDIVVHMGTLVAMIFHYRRFLIDMFVGDLYMLKCLVVASLPLLVVGFLFESIISAILHSPTIIAFSTIIFGLILLWCDQAKAKHKPLTMLVAIGIGLAQILALIPGASRTAVTISAGRLCGLSRRFATEFSFYLAIPTIGAIVCGKTLGVLYAGSYQEINWLPMMLGFIVSAATALAVIRVFLALVERVGFLPFVCYRLVLGGIMLSVLGYI